MLRMFLGVLTILFGLMSNGVFAQSWPTTQPIRVIVAFTAGSATDIVARTIFKQVGEQIGQTFVVENRGGAGGTLAAATIAHAPPDGYTILVTSSGFTVAPSIYSKLPYDPETDFRPIIPLASTPMVLVVSPNKGYKRVADLVKAAKAKPGSLNYGSAGIGSASHLPAERFRLSAGFEATHVPFKGAPEAALEVLTERIDFYFSPLPVVRGMIQDGKLLALAVSGSQRSSFLPNVPTTLEAGYPNSDYNFWIGLFAPGGTPAEIVNRLNSEVVKAWAVPAVKDALARIGAEPMKLSAQQFEALVHKEIRANAELIKAAGIKPN